MVYNVGWQNCITNDEILSRIKEEGKLLKMITNKIVFSETG